MWICQPNGGKHHKGSSETSGWHHRDGVHILYSVWSKPAAYPSMNSSSSCPMARPSSWGNVVILLKDRLSCRSDGQVTVGSKVSRGPTQLRETFSMLSESRYSSSTGSDWSWLPCRSSRVRLFRLCAESKTTTCKTFSVFSFNHLLVIQHTSHVLPGTELRETPADSCGSGPDGGDVPAAAGQSHHPSDRTESPTRYRTSPTGGSSPSLWTEQLSSHQIQTLRRRQIISCDLSGVKSFSQRARCLEACLKMKTMPLW